MRSNGEGQVHGNGGIIFTVLHCRIVFGGYGTPSDNAGLLREILKEHDFGLIPR